MFKFIPFAAVLEARRAKALQLKPRVTVSIKCAGIKYRYG